MISYSGVSLTAALRAQHHYNQEDKGGFVKYYYHPLEFPGIYGRTIVSIL